MKIVKVEFFFKPNWPNIIGTLIVLILCGLGYFTIIAPALSNTSGK